jgi:hypothetical protein
LPLPRSTKPQAVRFTQLNWAGFKYAVQDDEIAKTAILSPLRLPPSF